MFCYDQINMEKYALKKLIESDDEEELDYDIVTCSKTFCQC